MRVPRLDIILVAAGAGAASAATGEGMGDYPADPSRVRGNPMPQPDVPCVGRRMRQSIPPKIERRDAPRIDESVCHDERQQIAV